MKTFKDIIVELSTMQRIKRSKIMKVKGKMIARKRAIAMKKPPTPEKIQKALDRKLRTKEVEGIQVAIDSLNPKISAFDKANKLELKNIYRSPKDAITLEKVRKWGLVQVVKVFLGVPIVPGK